MPEGLVLAMPGWRRGGHVAVKLVGVFPGNAARGLPAHPVTIALLEAETGRLAALLDGTAITAARTAAAAALSARLLAREGARTAAVVGAGAVARALLPLLPLVGDFRELRVASRAPEHAEALAAEDHREITVYKAMGHVVEDLAAAELAVRRAREAAIGRVVAL